MCLEVNKLLNNGELDFKNIYLEIHAKYWNKFHFIHLPWLFTRFHRIDYNFMLLKKLVNKIAHVQGYYLDWWVNWIKSAPVRIKYKIDNELLYSHPLAFCNLIIDNKKFRMGFDLWDKYPLYISTCDDASIIDRWNKCEIYFKTNYFDARSRYRYRAPLGYVLKQEDTGREKAEKAYYEENIFPAGMPIFKGIYYLKGIYKSFRSKRKTFDINSLARKKKFCPIRNEMISKLSRKYDPPRFIKSYVEYLKTLGQSKISIDLPSNSRVTFRSSESIAMGSLLIGPPICNIYPKDFELHEYMVICKPNLSDFINKIEFYLYNDEKRVKLAEYAKNMWDEVMSPEKLSEYWVKTTISYLI